MSISAYGKLKQTSWLAPLALLNKTNGIVVRHRSSASRRLGKSGSALEDRTEKADNELLLVAPNSGSWTVLSGPFLDYWKKLPRSFKWQDARDMEGPLTLREREVMLLHLFHSGMLEVNGRGYYDCDMWKLPEIYPGFLCIHLTEACNFACKYCFADSVPGKAYMSKQVLDKVLEHCLRDIPRKSMTIDFHGGEPLLAWDNLLYAVRYAKRLNEEEKLGHELRFMFQTNASLLTPDKVKTMLDEGRMNCGVSLDGPAHVHDRNRIFAGSHLPTHATVVANLKKAWDLGLKTGALAVVHDPKDYVEVFRYFVNDLHLPSFRINYSSYIGRSTRMLDFPVDRAKSFAENWLKMVDEALDWCRSHEKRLSISDLDNQINNLVSKRRPFMCYRCPCGVGNSILGFALDGGVHACEEMASDGRYRLGSVLDPELNLATMLHTNPIALSLQERTVDNIPRCKRCFLRHICSGGCTSKTEAMFGEFMRESPMCGYFQVVFEGLMWRLYDNHDMVKWLGGRNVKKVQWPFWTNERLLD